MAEPNSVIAFYDERVLSHQPDTDAPFLPNRMERRIRQLLASLNVPWKYPEHAGRLGAILNLLELEPVPGLCFESGKPATREQLGRVHTSSYLSHIFDLRGKNAWLDVDTTAVSAGSVDAAEVAAAIEELGASGRMVGVVSHVPELAERVPTRFEVRRVGDTSTVQRVDA